MPKPRKDFSGNGFPSRIQDSRRKLASNETMRIKPHLSRSRLCQWIGFATMGLCVNPVSIFLLSLGTMTRWTIVGHHVCHGGFDKCGKAEGFSRFTFGVGSLKRRVVDWREAASNVSYRYSRFVSYEVSRSRFHVVSDLVTMESVLESHETARIRLSSPSVLASSQPLYIKIQIGIPNRFSRRGQARLDAAGGLER